MIGEIRSCRAQDDLRGFQESPAGMVAVVGGPVRRLIVFVGSLHLFRRLASLICLVCTPIVIPASAITIPKLASFISIIVLVL